MLKKTHPYDARQIMATNEYELFHYSTKGMDMVNLHHHDFYECYFFLSGDVTYIIEGKSYSLLPGDIVLVNTRELHQSIIHNKEIPYERIVLWINKSFLNSLGTEETDLKRCFEDTSRDNVIRADIETQQSVKTLLNKLISLEQYDGFGHDLLYKAYLVEIFVLLNSYLFCENAKLSIDIKKSNLIDEIIQYINEHLDEEISIDELSEKFFISKFHLLREFKKHSGATIHKFIVQKKLIFAKELILSGTPINRVYLQCGFGDYSNFFRAFKNEYGITPKEFYRLMSRNSGGA